MASAYSPHIRIQGRSFDLTAHNSVRHLLISTKGRKAIAAWLNTHKKSPDYEKVYSVVSDLTGGAGIAVDSLVAPAIAAAFLMSPGWSSSEPVRMNLQEVCRTCHVSDAAVSKGVRSGAFSAAAKSGLKDLTFVNLGTRGTGVRSISAVYEIAEGATGRVGATRLLFRDEQGMRMVSEIGKYPPRGSIVVFGNKAYRMWKNGLEWNMRNVVSINGTPTGGNVFIAEYFVKRQSPGRRSIDPKTALQEIKEKKARVSEIARAYSRRPAEIRSEQKVRNAGTSREAPQEIRPEYAFYQQKAPGGFASRESKEIAGRALVRKEESVPGPSLVDIYEVATHFGELTVHHVFRSGPDNVTFHKVHLNACPEISAEEAIPAPLPDVKRNISNYVRGIGGQLETDILMRVNNELGSLFRDNIARKFPAPDERFVSGIKIVGTEDYFKCLYVHLHLGLDKDLWVALNDEFLVKILQSEPLPSYTASTTYR